METIIGYIITFGLGILIASMYLFKKDKPSLLPVSEQTYPGLILTILIKKKKRKISEIVLQLKAMKEPLTIGKILLEFTDKNHEKTITDMNSYLNFSNKPLYLLPGEIVQLSLDFGEFIGLLDNTDFPYDRFRIIAASIEGKIFKSHELGYLSRWGLFKKDSGKYN